MENITPKELSQKGLIYSRVGIASFIISILIPFTIFFGEGGVAIGILMSLIGILIGIAGIIESLIRKRKKLFAVLGIVFNTFFVLFWILLMAMILSEVDRYGEPF